MRRAGFSIILWACIALQTLASLNHNMGMLSRSRSAHLHPVLHQRDTPQPLLATATEASIEEARETVQDAIARMTKLNKARLDKPARNRYKLKPGTKLTRRDVDDGDAPPPLLNITTEIAHAAALVAEADMAASLANGTAKLAKRADGTFWMKDITRQGTLPWGGDADYKVFRNVVDDYGADPTGVSDSTAQIQAAIDDGDRCGEGCNGSTEKNAIVYLPPGTYLVSSTIKVLFATQIIGDANDWPTIKAASSFVGLGVLSTDEYVGGTGPDGKDAEYYVNTARFYSQIRNLRIDITDTDPNAYVCAIHYQVAQATSLQEVELIATTGTTQQGIYAENGSGGMMSDITFTGGNFGLYGGNQQFSAQRMTFVGCKTAVQIIWDWGWVWKSIDIQGGDVGFRLVSDDGSGNIGSVSFIDSKFTDVTTAIVMAPASQDPGSGTTGLILDNTKIDGPIVDTAGESYLEAGYYENWVLGPVYSDGERSWSSGSSSPYFREASLLGDSVADLDVAPYFERKKNQYADKSVSDFVQLKSLGAAGDGSTDDTAAVQQAFNDYGDGSKIIFVDSGTYILTDTITIPKDAKIHGEAWSQFAAYGDAFSDASNPRVMLKVGEEGDVGTVEMQDLILTTKGGTAGVVLMQWNVKAANPGDAALWDVHARIGGATGTELTPDECPALTDGTNPASCQAAALMLHITPGASGYFENMWLWVADHMIDDPDLDDAYNDMTQVSIYVARGFLIESTDATWLYGTSSEHSVYYQYNFHGAQNIFTTMIQTEAPYYQPTPKPPAPFGDQVGVYNSDPDYSCSGGDFDGCDEAWAVIMTGCQNIHIGGAGTYSWFSTYTQDCIDGHSCQKALWYLDSNYDNVRLQHVIAIGAEYILVADGNGVLSTDNLAIESHPAWAQISVFDVPSQGQAPNPGDGDGSHGGCNTDDNTWKDVDTREGEYFDTSVLDIDSVNVPNGRQYITIVNLTPYKFVYQNDTSHTYQMDEWDFGDIPPGRSRQCVMDYYDGEQDYDPVDDKGEAYYVVEGTDRQFNIKARTHYGGDEGSTWTKRTIVDLSDWGLGQREFEDPQVGVPVSFVITGSEDYGYYTSLSFDTSGPDAWMSNLQATIGDRQIKHVIMPGSHDSGMDRISTSWFGSAPNTQTQGLSIYGQLKVGVRYFDLRVVRLNDGTFVAAHVNDERAGSIFGGAGEPLDEILDDINTFTSEAPGEVIIIWLRYLVDILTYEVEDRYWNETTMQEFYSKLETIDRRCPNLLEENDSNTLDELTFGTYLDASDGAGCVIFVNGGTTDPDIQKVTTEDLDRGIYGTGRLPRTDHWSEKSDAKEVADDQVSYYPNLRATIGGEDDTFYISQWVATLSALPEYGIELTSIFMLNPVLYWYGMMEMSPTGFPTVMLMDYAGVRLQGEHDEEYWGAELKTLAIGLNLYLVSENCDISTVKNPLARSTAESSRTNGLLQSVSSSGSTWNGIIFANGTVLDDPPANYHPWKESVLRNGTVFANGTVLTHDVRVSDSWYKDHTP